MDCGAKVMINLKISNIFAEKFTRMTKIIGIGNALVDVLTSIESDNTLSKLSLPKGSMELIDLDGFKQICSELCNSATTMATGGSAANTIKALAKLGARPGFIGKVGNDDYGKAFEDGCNAAEIEAYLVKSDEQTGVASTFISPDGQRTFATYLGAASSLNESDITKEMLSPYDYLYLEGYLIFNESLIIHIAKTAKEAGLKICLDMASFNIVENNKYLFDLLLNDYVDIVFANEEESKAFTGKSPKEALAILAKLCEIAVVKVGKDGAYAKRGNETAFAKAESVEKVIDTTGAGDYFAAGFLYSLTKEEGLEKALKTGSILSGSVIQTIGTTLTDDTWNEIRTKVATENELA